MRKNDKKADIEAQEPNTGFPSHVCLQEGEQGNAEPAQQTEDDGA